MKNKLLVMLFAMAAFFSAHAASAEVARSIITTGVVDREPTNDLERVQPDTERVIYYTELRGMSDRTVTHVWRHAGEVMAEVSFEVGGPRWRVWSSKNMMPGWSGAWSVSVVDEEGNVLAEKEFTYVAVETPAAMTEPEGAAEEPAAEEMGGEEMDAEEMTGEQPMEPASEEMNGGE